MRAESNAYLLWLRSLSALFMLLSISGAPRTSASAAQTTRSSIVVHLFGGTNSLDEIGLYKVSYRYDDGHTGQMPVGWRGFFTEDTGIACEPFGSQNGKKAFLLHPIWRGGTGDTDQTYFLRLPNAKKVVLRFAIAMREGFVGPHLSDGATFRVFLNDNKLLDQNKTDANWSTYSFDLTPYAGQTVALRFETDPGPKRDPSFDYALWGDRQIGIQGGPIPPPPLFQPDNVVLQKEESDYGGCSPTFPLREKAAYTLHTDVLPNPKQLLDGWIVRLQPKGHKPTMAPLGIGFGAALIFVAPNGTLIRSDSPLVQVHINQHVNTETGIVVREATYTFLERTVHVRAVLYPPSGRAVRLDLESPEPYIAAVDFGTLGPVAFQRGVEVPYLGTVAYLPRLGLFANTIPDFVRSHASALDGNTALYQPLTNGQRNHLHETAYYALSNNLRDVLPTPPNPPSPYIGLMGQLAILDVWGGTFQQNAAWLQQLATYDLTHLYVIVHNWQHGGYDNQLPDTVPANTELGGEEGMRLWVHTAESLGERIALHENYVDFYPNAPSFTWQDVARDSQGNPQPSWKNLIQSYALAPTAILKYAKPITSLVQQHYSPNASYLDVHSAVPPWWHVDFQAGRPGAGEFHTVWNAYKALWQLFREVHHGPVTGEGAQHWRWSGLLDGVEAQFGLGVPINGGEEAPLFVDFDLLKIHPCQCNHGMGYLERWLSEGYQGYWWLHVPPTKILDEYRMQEIAYGHNGFIPAQLVSNLAYVWQEENLLVPLSSRYALAMPLRILYSVDGKLVPAEQVIAQSAAFDRVMVEYNNGLRVYANASSSPWLLAINGQTIELPQYGWLAVGKDILAYTARHNGEVVDYLQTPNRLFVNARTDVAGLSLLPVHPYVLSFQQTGPRQFLIRFAWNVGAPLPKGAQVFVHLTQPGLAEKEGIVLQPPSGFSQPPEHWPIGPQPIVGEPVSVTLPADMADGDYLLKLGLYLPQTGERLALQGDDDGFMRIGVGTLHVANNGANLTFKPDTKWFLMPSTLLNAHRNVLKKSVDFGSAITNGSFLLTKEEEALYKLTPFPRDRVFPITLRLIRPTKGLPPKAFLPNWKSGIQVTAVDAQGRKLATVPVTTSLHLGARMQTFQVNTIQGATSYIIAPRR